MTMDDRLVRMLQTLDAADTVGTRDFLRELIRQGYLSQTSAPGYAIRKADAKGETDVWIRTGLWSNEPQVYSTYDEAYRRGCMASNASQVTVEIVELGHMVLGTHQLPPPTSEDVVEELKNIFVTVDPNDAAKVAAAYSKTRPVPPAKGGRLSTRNIIPPDTPEERTRQANLKAHYEGLAADLAHYQDGGEDG